MHAHSPSWRAATGDRGLREIQGAGLDLHFQAAITAGEIEGCGAGAAGQNARGQGGGDGLHGGGFGAGEQLGVVSGMHRSFTWWRCHSGGKGDGSAVGVVLAALFEELVEGHTSRVTCQRTCCVTAKHAGAPAGDDAGEDHHQ